jgi:hypothetical protein
LAPQAFRLLRPGGRLWFLRNSTLSILCAPDEELPPAEALVRPQRGLGRMEWPDEEGVEWHLPHGELFRLLRGTGFDVVDLVELYAPDDATDHEYYVTFSAAWSRKWPVEEIWVAAKPT